MGKVLIWGIDVGIWMFMGVLLWAGNVCRGCWWGYCCRDNELGQGMGYLPCFSVALVLLLVPTLAFTFGISWNGTIVKLAGGNKCQCQYAAIEHDGHGVPN